MGNNTKDRRVKIKQATEIIEQVLINSYDYPALKILQNLEDAGFVNFDEVYCDHRTKNGRFAINDDGMCVLCRKENL